MIHLLTPDDFALWKTIRLEALAENPPAYDGAFEEESERSDALWVKDLETSFVFIYMADERPVGMAGYYLSSFKKKRHMGTVFTVYVQQAFRGKGVMDWLMPALCYHARDSGIEQLHLSVGTYNTPALRCYERHGFAIYGTEPRTIKIGDDYIDEYLMVKYL